MSALFAERRIACEGGELRCFEAGEGAVVVGLHGQSGGSAPSPLETLLAQKFRVLALESPAFAAGAPQEAARLVAEVARTLGLGPYSLIASGSAVAPALRHALEAPAQVEALVLLSPRDLAGDLEAQLGAVEPSTLILVGTKDAPESALAARRFADRLPNGYFMVVYDAGPAMERERPAALFEAVADFIERRGGFVLERQDSALAP